MTDIVVASTISLAEFRKYWLQKFFKSKQTILLLICLGGISIVSFMELMPMFFVYLAVLITFTIPVFLLFKAMKAYNQNDVLNKEIVYTFSEDWVHLKASFLDKKLDYSKLLKIDWEQDFLMIYLDQTLALFVNQKAIKGTGKSQELEQFLATKAK